VAMAVSDRFRVGSVQECRSGGCQKRVLAFPARLPYDAFIVSKYYLNGSISILEEIAF